MKAKVATVIGLVVFLVLAGTTGSLAYWSNQASIQSTVTATDLAALNCTAPVKLVNGGFETPNISPDTIRSINNGTGVTGWNIQNDNVIELWRGYGGITPPEGSQFAELNGNGAGTLYQDVATTPGQVLHWSISHRGREGNDTMRVSINAAGSALVQQDQWTTGTAAFVRHEGDYVVPAGQTSTRFSLTAVSTANNAPSIGNLIDDVAFGTGPCLQSTATVSNYTTPGSTTYAVGNVVEYTTTLTNAGGALSKSTVFTASVPAGLTYVAGSLAVNGVTKSDTAGNDEAEISGTTITARLGQGATATVGGTISPAGTVTVRFRATIQTAASGGNLSYTSSTAYVDSVAPTWPLAAVSPTLTTPVVGQADLATSVTSSAQLNAGNRNAEWVFRVVNNGPAATVATITASTTGTPAITGRTIEYNTGSGWQTASGTTFSVGTLASAAGVDIRIRGTVPAAAASGTSYSATVSAASSVTDPTAGNNSATRAVVLDTVAPTTPTNFAATRNSTTQVNLTWTASTDAVGVAGYRIYRNGVLVATTTGTGTGYNDTGLTAHTPYWYWIEAIDAAGNVSAASTGNGAVTYATSTSYRVSYPYGGAGLCVVASANSTTATILTGSCTGTAALRQWEFQNYSGDVVYTEFFSGTARRWTVPDATSGTDLETAAAGNTNARSRWELTAYWDAATSTASVEIRNASTGLCLDVDGASTTAGAAVQQYTCNQTVAQRFLLVQP